MKPGVFVPLWQNKLGLEDSKASGKQQRKTILCEYKIY